LTKRYIPQTELLDLLHHSVEQSLRQSHSNGMGQRKAQPARFLWIDRTFLSRWLHDTDRIPGDEGAEPLQARSVGAAEHWEE